MRRNSIQAMPLTLPESPMVFARSPYFRILFILNLLVFAFLALPANGATILYLWPWTGVYQLSLGLCLTTVLLLLFLDGREKKSQNPFSWYHPAVFLLIAAFGVSCYLSEFTDRAAFNLIVPVSALALGYITHCQIRNSEHPEKMIFILFQGLGVIVFLLYFRSLILWVLTTAWGVKSGVASSIDSLAGYSFKSFSWLNEPNGHPFGHPNYTAGFSLLTLPLVVSLSIFSQGRYRLFWSLVSICGVATLFSSGSRAGTGGLAVAVLAGAAFFLKGKLNTRRHLIMGFAGALLLAVILVLSQPRWRSTIAHIASGEGFGVGEHARLNLLTTGLKMGMESPLWGNGPGTTPIIYPAFWNGSGTLSNSYQLHCTPLQIWVDFGFAGILACGGLLFAFGQSWRRLSLRPDLGSKQDRPLPLIHGAGIGIGSYLLFSLTDHQLDIYFMSGILAIYAGIFSALDRIEPQPGEKSKLSRLRTAFHFAATLTIFVLCLGFGWKQYRLFEARKELRIAFSAYQKNDSTSFLDSIQKTEKRTPNEPFTYNILGWLAAEARFKGNPLLAEGKLAETAKDFWERSLALFEAQEFCHYNLGWLLLAEQPNRAAYHFRRAAQINPGKRGVYFGLALALKKEGLAEAATSALALECLSQPEFALLPLWEEPNFKAVLPSVKTSLAEFYEGMTVRHDLSAVNRQSLRHAEAITDWWWREPFDTEALANSPHPQIRWWGRTLQEKETEQIDFWNNRSLRAPIVLTYLGWKEPENGKRRLMAAKLLALNEPLSEVEGNYLQAYLVQKEKSFPQLLLESRRESVLPLNVYRNTRLAFGLMGHNLDGPNPDDFFIYEQNLLLKITEVWLFPRRGYLSGVQMRRFLEELPKN